MRPFEQETEALRADLWLKAHPEAPHAQQPQIVRPVHDVFYARTQARNLHVHEQGIAAAHQAVAALGR